MFRKKRVGLDVGKKTLQEVLHGFVVSENGDTVILGQTWVLQQMLLDATADSATNSATSTVECQDGPAADGLTLHRIA